MTASSVTGIGQGSADKAGQKGSEHLFVGVEKLIGTRVIWAGVGAVGTNYVFPEPLPGANSDYLVLANDVTGNHSVQAVLHAANDYITFTGTGTDAIAFAVIRVNNASAASNPPGLPTQL